MKKITENLLLKIYSVEHLQVIHQVKPDTVAVSSVQSQIFACIEHQTGVTLSQILAEIYQIFVVSELVADTLQLRYQNPSDYVLRRS